ncbi:MAG TPA: hypothetical protein VMN35_03995 [Gaiellaceae bacterium]|nr:hypothetical protein [Gaiellaceae bacterium]
MAERTFVRMEIAFDGGQILSWLVTSESADALDRKLSAGGSGTISLDAQEGTIIIVLDRVLYAKRYAREPRVGFAE